MIGVPPIAQLESQEVILELESFHSLGIFRGQENVRDRYRKLVLLTG